MQSGPIYSGVYPMTLKVNETLPNLNNVTRSYSLNEFGARKKRSSKRQGGELARKQSKKRTVLNRRGKRMSSRKMISAIVEEEDGNNFGCGLYGCSSCGSRSFGCGCGDKDNET
jgi:hypothetical protein